MDQDYRGNVTIVPNVGWKDYKNLLNNLPEDEYLRTFQMSYLHTLRKMAHIRSFFGIEREFNRYYERLRNQLRDVAHAELDVDPTLKFEYSDIKMHSVCSLV
jgi:hypothetical protein